MDDIGLLARSINQAGLNLRALVDDVAAQVAGVSAASEQIAQGNDDLSQRTERAAASLEETAVSIEQITATVRQNAQNTRTATEVAQQTMAAADEGAHVVQGVVQTMGQIAAGSQRIADITGLIDSIAFQTNILALNAAVEAARGRGGAGRGFAVVAGEVRSLAQRSAEAAKEIRALIQASVEQVKAGSAQAQEAGERIASVVEYIRRVLTLIQEIATASAEQSGGVAVCTAGRAFGGGGGALERCAKPARAGRAAGGCHRGVAGGRTRLSAAVCPVSVSSSLHIPAVLLAEAEAVASSTIAPLERAVFDAAPDGIAVVDETATLVRVNPALVRMAGYPNAASLEGRPLDVLLPPRRAGTDTPRRCWCWTWTISRASTTPTGTRWGTGCCR